MTPFDFPNGQIPRNCRAPERRTDAEKAILWAGFSVACLIVALVASLF